jgi:hypothetical protein
LYRDFAPVLVLSIVEGACQKSFFIPRTDGRSESRSFYEGKKEKGEGITEKGTKVAEKVLQKEKNLSQFCLLPAKLS